MIVIIVVIAMLCCAVLLASYFHWLDAVKTNNQAEKYMLMANQRLYEADKIWKNIGRRNAGNEFNKRQAENNASNELARYRSNKYINKSSADKSKVIDDLWETYNELNGKKSAKVLKFERPLSIVPPENDEPNGAA